MTWLHAQEIVLAVVAAIVVGAAGHAIGKFFHWAEAKLTRNTLKPWPSSTEPFVSPSAAQGIVGHALGAISGGAMGLSGQSAAIIAVQAQQSAYQAQQLAQYKPAPPKPATGRLAEVKNAAEKIFPAGKARDTFLFRLSTDLDLQRRLLTATVQDAANEVQRVYNECAK